MNQELSTALLALFLTGCNLIGLTPQTPNPSIPPDQPTIPVQESTCESKSMNISNNTANINWTNENIDTLKNCLLELTSVSNLKLTGYSINISGQSDASASSFTTINLNSGVNDNLELLKGEFGPGNFSLASSSSFSDASCNTSRKFTLQNTLEEVDNTVKFSNYSINLSFESC